MTGDDDLKCSHPGMLFQCQKTPEHPRRIWPGLGEVLRAVLRSGKLSTP